jgi:hypothetical protein
MVQKPNISTERLKPASAKEFRDYLATFKEARDKISGNSMLFDCVTETFNGSRREFYFESTDKGRLLPLAMIHTTGKSRTFAIASVMPLVLS